MKNENTADRALRVVLGVALLLAAFLVLGVTSGAVLGIIAAVVGAVLLLTGTVGFCPAYRLIGINTCKLERT